MDNVGKMSDESIDMYGIQKFADKIINDAQALIDFVETQNLTDSQWFINWEDKLNELSVKDHSKMN